LNGVINFIFRILPYASMKCVARINKLCSSSDATRIVVLGSRARQFGD
jgi:hypothetical protein